MRNSHRDLGAVAATRPSFDTVPGAWVVFNGTGTPAIIKAYNVASITDNGAGDYTINFTLAFKDGFYCPASWIQDTTAIQGWAWGTTDAPTSAAHRILIGAAGGTDYNRISLIYHGRMF